MVIEIPTTNHTAKTIANYVFVLTEFSYDRTCAVSSATHWVAPLKDRKEMKASNVLIANVQTWSDIQFSIGQCQNEYVVFDWALSKCGVTPR